ncbi:MAG: MFS transporter [Rickettsiaceae bacterium]|nr:MFS transporter [Rickettsiaceae bacterium]
MKHIDVDPSKQNNNLALKNTIYSAIGSGLEYYDFVIYGMMAKYLSVIFFQDQSSTIQLIQTFSIFAIGYLVRPLGGFIIGLYADIYGRKKAFLFSTSVIAVATMTIGILPTYEQIGILSTVILLICRVIQGISFGAELPGATIISLEHSTGKFGKLCSIILSSTSIGSLFALMILTLITNYFTSEQIITHGIWRIPFILGGTLGLLNYYFRKNISETPQFLAQNETNNLVQILNLLQNNYLTLLTRFCLILPVSVMVISNIYFPTYLSHNYSYSMQDIYSASTISMFSSILWILLGGWLVDYIYKISLANYILIFALIITPLMIMLLNYQTYFALILFLCLYQLILGLYFSSIMPVLSNLFEVKIRFCSVALIYNLTFTLASVVPIICSAYNNSGLVLLLCIICTILLALFINVYITSPNKKTTMFN